MFLVFFVRIDSEIFDSEVIEISHKVSDRAIFANGAILAGKWLINKPAGSYTMQDIYSS